MIEMKMQNKYTSQMATTNIVEIFALYHIMYGLRILSWTMTACLQETHNILRKPFISSSFRHPLRGPMSSYNFLTSFHSLVNITSANHLPGAIKTVSANLNPGILWRVGSNTAHSRAAYILATPVKKAVNFTSHYWKSGPS